MPVLVLRHTPGRVLVTIIFLHILIDEEQAWHVQLLQTHIWLLWIIVLPQRREQRSPTSQSNMFTLEPVDTSSGSRTGQNSTMQAVEHKWQYTSNVVQAVVHSKHSPLSFGHCCTGWHAQLHIMLPS